VVEPWRPDVAVGRALAVPFAWAGVPGREELPDTGWDGVLRWAVEDRALGRTPDALSALEITLLPSHRGAGGSAIVLDAMRRIAADRGLRHMVAPVRPTGKAAEPATPMQEYA
jgi:GNAT superfamily N-acetyltransferase